MFQSQQKPSHPQASLQNETFGSMGSEKDGLYLLQADRTTLRTCGLTSTTGRDHVPYELGYMLYQVEEDTLFGWLGRWRRAPFVMD